jgi:hypothetical protein
MQANCYDLRQIKVAFILQGTSFTRFCLERGIDPSNANKALKGKWKGDKASEICRLITEATNVNQVGETS